MHQLVKSISIENMLNQRNAVIDRVRSARSILMEAKEITKGNAMNLETALAGGRYRYDRNALVNDEDPLPEITKQIDAQLWGQLMHESGLRTFMDAKAREQWDKAIYEQKTPALTKENIDATFSQLYDARSSMFERGVIEIFQGLSWDYKSNLPHKFGKRIVVSYFMDSYGITSGYSRADKLADLERVMYMLDGKPAPDHRTGIVQKCGDIQRERVRSKTDTKREAEDDYFRVKWFKNHNGHFYFKRPDLVEKMNLIVAKHYPGALPPII